MIAVTGTYKSKITVRQHQISLRLKVSKCTKSEKMSKSSPKQLKNKTIVLVGGDSIDVCSIQNCPPIQKGK
jgi:hypothetical protein